MPDIRQSTAVLDNFNRADEIPLSNGGKWSQSKPSIWWPMVLQTNNATHHDSGTSSDSYWNVQTFDGDEAEVWATPEGGGANGIAWALDLWSDPAAANGYRFRLELTSITQRWRLYRFAGGSGTVLDESTTGTFATASATYRLLLRRNGNDVEAWFSTDSGANWTLEVSATDVTYVNGLYLGIGINDNSSDQLLGWDDFGGGGGRNRPQMYRWIKN